MPPADVPKIWLIGGTSDSRAIAQRLSDRLLPWVASVVTPRAQRLYDDLTGDLPGDLHVGPLTPDRLPQWLQTQGITHIIDASHPFAVEISRQAIATGLPYLRYERPAMDLDPITHQHPNITTVATWEALFTAALAPPSPQTILLTTGLHSLHHVIPHRDRAQWWARILPSSRDAAIALGFPSDHLLLHHPPTPAADEQHLWQRLGITTALAKASGTAGGLPQKIAAAIALQRRLIILRRPVLPYPQQTGHLQGVSNWLREATLIP